MATKKELDDFICINCGCTDCDLEQDWDDFDGESELVAEDLVCDNCGHRKVLY